MRIGKGDGERGLSRQLPLHGDGRLHDVGGAHLSADLLHDLRLLFGREACDGRNIRIEIRIGEQVLLLGDPVVALRGENVAQREAIVKHAETRADHAFRAPGSGSRAGRPSDADTRRPIAMVADIGLRLVAQAQVERDIRTNAPVVADECSRVELMHADVGDTGRDAELRRSAAQRRGLRGREPGLR